MCNYKGYDVAYNSNYVWIERHICRVFGDCGHCDNTLEEAAEMCAQWHEDQAKAFRDGAHCSLQHFKEYIKPLEIPQLRRVKPRKKDLQK